jgi:hypothetical protein
MGESLAARAKADHERYIAAMIQPNGWQVCARIEQDWALYGYPPAIVSKVLTAVADGQDFDAAEDAALGFDDEESAPPPHSQGEA